MSHLAAAGEVSDESGMASTLLAREVGYPGSSIAFAQLLSGMERSGLIRREVRGKRTYRITMAPGSGARLMRDGDHRALSRVSATAAFDYDELARRLLIQVVRELAVARRELARLARSARAGPGAPDDGRLAGQDDAREAGQDDARLASQDDAREAGQDDAREAGQDAGPPPHLARTLEDALTVQPAATTADVLPVRSGGSPSAGSPGGHGSTPLAQPAGTVAGVLPDGLGGIAGALPGGLGVPGSGSQSGPASGPGERSADEPAQPGGTVEGTVADLQRELASVRALQSRISAENARLREQLRAARRSLARLRGRAARRPVTEDLDADETGLLDHLLAPSGKPGDSDDPAPQ